MVCKTTHSAKCLSSKEEEFSEKMNRLGYGKDCFITSSEFSEQRSVKNWSYSRSLNLVNQPLKWISPIFFKKIHNPFKFSNPFQFSHGTVNRTSHIAIAENQLYSLSMHVLKYHSNHNCLFAWSIATLQIQPFLMSRLHIGLDRTRLHTPLQKVAAPTSSS